MQLCIFSGRHFEDTSENAQWREVKQMQPVWVCILSCKCFEDSYENAQWRNVKQMQPMWLCIISGWKFEDTHAIKKIPKKTGILFSKIPVSVFESNPGIPVFSGIPQGPGGQGNGDNGHEEGSSDQIGQICHHPPLFRKRYCSEIVAQSNRVVDCQYTTQCIFCWRMSWC